MRTFARLFPAFTVYAQRPTGLDSLFPTPFISLFSDIPFYEPQVDFLRAPQPLSGLLCGRYPNPLLVPQKAPKSALMSVLVLYPVLIGTGIFGFLKIGYSNREDEIN
jgi:hypothetical protein